MDFDPFSEPRSMGVNTLNQYLGNTRRILRDASGSFEDRRSSPELIGRAYPVSVDSVTMGPEMVFQRRRLDEFGNFVDFEVPGEVRRRAIWNWLHELPDPMSIDPQKLYGPIIAQEEGEPTDPGAAQEAVGPESYPFPPSEPDAEGSSGLRATRTRQAIRNSLIAEPSSARISTTQVQAKPALAESSQVRNRLARNLRDISGHVPRDAEDGPQIPDDAPRVDSLQEIQNPHRGRQTTRRPQLADTNGEFLARRTRVAAYTRLGRLPQRRWTPNLQEQFYDFPIHRDNDCREDGEEGGDPEQAGSGGEDDVFHKSEGSIGSDGLSGVSLVCQNGSHHEGEGRVPSRDKGKMRAADVFSGIDNSSDRGIDNDGSIGGNDDYQEERMTLHRRRWGIVWPSGVPGNLSLPQDQDFAIGARFMASSSQERTFPGSLSLPQLVGAANKVQKSTRTPGSKSASQPGVYLSGGTAKKQKLTPLPPLPSLYPNRQTNRDTQAGPSTHSAQPPNPGTTQVGASQEPLHPSGRLPFCLGIYHLEDPFTRTPEPQEEPSSQSGDINQGVARDAPLPGNRGPQPTLQHNVNDPSTRTPEPEPRVPDRGGQVQLPFVLGLDNIHHPFSNTHISPEVNLQLGFYPDFSAMDPNKPVDALRSHPPTISMPAQPQGPDDSDNESTIAQIGHPPSSAMGSRQNGGQEPRLRVPAPVRPVGQAPGHLEESPAPATSIGQVPGEEPRRIELVDRPMAIEGQAGSLALAPSPEGSKSAGDSEVDEGEPEFPEQVYNVLLVGAEGVGQTSMILNLNGYWTNAGRKEKSLWTKLFRNVEKNRRYEADDVVDTYNVKLVLWDASLQCAGEMVQANEAGWDAVVICSDVIDPATMQEPLNWWIRTRQQLRPATKLPIVTVMAALKRDLLPAHREARSREHGEFTAARFGGAVYAELSAKTRQGLREFWFGLIRRLREDRVEAWRAEVRGYQRRVAEWERREMRERERAYWALTGERPGRRL